MFCQAGFDQWLRTIMQHLPHLSKPQATVLALWSFGMVLGPLVCPERGQSLAGHRAEAQGPDGASAAA